jgi:hypothetical protein
VLLEQLDPDTDAPAGGEVVPIAAANGGEQTT